MLSPPSSRPVEDDLSGRARPFVGPVGASRRPALAARQRRPAASPGRTRKRGGPEFAGILIKRAVLVLPALKRGASPADYRQSQRPEEGPSFTRAKAVASMRV